MSGSKHFDKIAWAATAVILVITLLFMNGGALGLEARAQTMGYETRLFDNTRVHTIDIVMDDWDGFIANATSEEYHTAAVVIDGEAYKNVGIRGKGNTSLSTVSSMDSDRYSFKIEFDHYDSSITYHGLDKLSLNNLIQDSTMMKDYLTYTMMNEFGAAAPLCSFVYITVNGEDWGLYLAAEGVEDSFLKRNYGSDYGELYKPDSTGFGGGRGNGKDFNMEDFLTREESDETAAQGSTTPNRGSFNPSSGFGGEMPDRGGFDPSRVPGAAQGETNSGNRDKFSPGGGRGEFGGMGSSDVKLQYVDDNASSYSNIWNNAKTDITAADQARLIESLKKLSEGKQIDSVVNVEQVIRYFVVHNYVCNGDSYTGSMIHNYYLYEEDGQMEMIPWDYNLAFGTFQGGNAQSTVNTPIDAPVSGGAGEDRPMWNWILSDAGYTELYHQYFEEFLNRVDVQGIIENAYQLIKPYVEKDPTAFYTYEKFEAGIAALRQFCALRSESISMQLENGETISDMGYVDTSDLILSDMGSMGMGGGMQGAGGGKGNFGGRDWNGGVTTNPDADPNTSLQWNAQKTSAVTLSGPQQMPGMGSFTPPQMPEGFSGGIPGQLPEGGAPVPPDASGSVDSSQDSTLPSRDPSQMPGGGFDFSMTVGDSAPSGSSNLIWLAVSVLVLGAGLIIAKLYRY